MGRGKKNWGESFFGEGQKKIFRGESFLGRGKQFFRGESFLGRGFLPGNIGTGERGTGKHRYVPENLGVIPMFPGTYVPRYLCSPVPMFPGKFFFYPSPKTIPPPKNFFFTPPK